MLADSVVRIPAVTERDTPSSPSWWLRTADYLGLSALSAFIMAAVSEYFPSPDRPSLTLGTGDHVVLAPQGLNWADPKVFAGDWFMESAPQPHWMFDYIVQFGRVTGHLVPVLFLYWALTCVVFGLATGVLARRWGRGHPWLASAAVSVVAAVIPFTIAGSTWLGYPSAVPNMLGSAMLYLASALVITGHYRWTLLILPLLAAVHVQIGAIALVVALLGAIFCLPLMRQERPAPLLVGIYAADWVLSAGIVAAAIRSRKVASEQKDFVEICNTIIPYHCAADTWVLSSILVVIGTTILTLAAVVYVPQRRRLVYLGTIGVCAVGTLVAMFLDRYHFPVLGELMQSLNGYRVALAMYPYASWAVVLPFLRPPTTRGRQLASAAVVVGVALMFVGPFSKIRLAVDSNLTIESNGWVILGTFVLLVVAAGVAAWLTGGKPLLIRRIASGSVLVLFLVWCFGGMWDNKARYRSHPSPVIWTDRGSLPWGKVAREIIPTGTQVLVSPRSSHLKLPLERGIVVDCKNIPYGGKPYAQWKERMADLGGQKQCFGPDEGTYDKLPGKTLVAVAEKYGAKAIIVKDDASRPQVKELKSLGWKAHPVNAGWVKTIVMLHPKMQTGGTS